MKLEEVIKIKELWAKVLSRSIGYIVFYGILFALYCILWALSD